MERISAGGYLVLSIIVQGTCRGAMYFNSLHVYYMNWCAFTKGRSKMLGELPVHLSYKLLTCVISIDIEIEAQDILIINQSTFFYLVEKIQKRQETSGFAEPLLRECL